MSGFDGGDDRATRISPHRVRRAREAVGLLQREVADWIGVSTTLISHWECGMSSPRASRIPGYAAALGIEPHELFDQERPEAASR